MAAKAASRALKELGGASSIVGIRMVVAPRASSWVARSEAWWRVRVMRMRMLVRLGILIFIVGGWVRNSGTSNDGARISSHQFLI